MIKSEKKATAPKNAYLLLREAKIARNQERLRELGLERRLSPVDVDVLPSSKKRKPVSKRITPPSFPERRSSRLQGSSVNYTEVSVDNELGKKRGKEGLSPPLDFSSSVTSQHSHALTLEQLKVINDSSLPETQPLSSLMNSPKNSARVMYINVEKLLFGTANDDDEDGVLGVLLPTTGKAFVMLESARRAVLSDQYQVGPISFNKYSGIQEWGNDVLFLWVNLGAPNSEVVNVFLENGRQVTWYGGSKMHDETNSIRKLKRVGMHAAAGGANLNQAVVLWCREYDRARKAFGPYVCLGRLSVRYSTRFLFVGCFNQFLLTYGSFACLTWFV